MAGLLSRLILTGVIRSALALEAEAVSEYEQLRAQAERSRGRTHQLGDSLSHILEEERLHVRILEDTGAGGISLPRLEGLLREHASPGLTDVKPLDADGLAQWERGLSSALEHEEKTWIFYGNLRRSSRVPAVRKAFEVLAAMEKEHLDILRRLLGRA